MSEFRTDPLFGNLCIVARERASRPHRIRVKDQIEPSGSCPLCPGNEAMCPPETARITDGQGDPAGSRWQIRSFPNRYPALQLELEPELTDLSQLQTDAGVLSAPTTYPGFGVHEVIVESPNHLLPFWAQDEEAGKQLFRFLQTRVRDLYKDRRIFYTQIFKNHRASAGGSIEHPHMQLLGLPFLPAPIKRLMAGRECLVCALLRREQEGASEKGKTSFSSGSASAAASTAMGSATSASAGSKGERSPGGSFGKGDTAHRESPSSKPLPERLLAETSRFIALADYAPSYSYQFSIYPKKHCPGIDLASKDEIDDLVHLCHGLFSKLERIHGEVGLNIVLFTQPNPNGFAKPPSMGKVEDTMHWFLRVFPRLGRHAGFELSTGIPIVQVAPEDAARTFREKGI